MSSERSHTVFLSNIADNVFLSLYTASLSIKDEGWGYTHDGRADKNPYPHDRRADKDSYPHDRMWLTICVA